MKSALALLSLSLLVGCATPTSIDIGKDTKITVHTLDKVNLPAAKVLDQNGKPMADQVITWEVTPPEVAALSADKKAVEPKADGDATVTAKSGKLSAKMTLVVSLPDTIEIGGVTEGQTLAVGATANLSATVKADGEVVEGQTPEWSVSDSAIASLANGVLTGVAPGEVTVTATLGAVTSSVKVMVVAADATAQVK